MCGRLCFAYWQTGQNVQRGLWSVDLLAPQGSLAYTLALLATVGPIFLGVMGAWCCGQEFKFRTWPELVTHGASRTQIWLGLALPLVETIFWSSELRRWLPVWNQRAVNGALFGTDRSGWSASSPIRTTRRSGRRPLSWCSSFSS